MRQEFTKFLERINHPQISFFLGKMYADGMVGRLSNGRPDYVRAKSYFEGVKLYCANHYLGVLYALGMVGRLPNGEPDTDLAEMER